MIRHIVALKFQSDVTSEKKAELYSELAALSHHIDGILDFRTFANVSPEVPVVRGFHDIFWFDFRDAHVRDAYLEHPAHKIVGAKLVAAVEGGLDGIFVADVEL
jgi:N12 class adenine-specific DNA methylase